jgi:hypothetical protein
MKRTIITLALAGAMLLLGTVPAFATHPEPAPANENAAPNTEDCRPGGNSHINGSWTMMTQQAYEDMLLDRIGVQADTPLPPERVDGDIVTWGELIDRSATATWDFCDHNDDGYACVMRQTLPGGVYYITLDNHAFPSGGTR